MSNMEVASKRSVMARQASSQWPQQARLPFSSKTLSGSREASTFAMAPLISCQKAWISTTHICRRCKPFGAFSLRAGTGNSLSMNAWLEPEERTMHICSNVSRPRFRSGDGAACSSVPSGFLSGKKYWSAIGAERR